MDTTKSYQINRLKYLLLIPTDKRTNDHIQEIGEFVSVIHNLNFLKMTSISFLSRKLSSFNLINTPINFSLYVVKSTSELMTPMKLFLSR